MIDVKKLWKQAYGRKPLNLNLAELRELLNRLEGAESELRSYKAALEGLQAERDVLAAQLQALIDNEPGLLQQLVGDFRNGDAAELEQSTGILARTIIKYAIEQVERVMR